MLRQTLFAVTSVALLTACTQDGRVNENIAGGAIAGAAVGAITGAIIGNRKGAVIGAGVGAIAGAGIGAYLDEQQKELEKNLEGTGATVTNTGEELLVNLPSEVTFAVGKANIQKRFRQPLARVAETLVKYESSVVDVVGHTDNTGSEAFNQKLSEERANRVATFLQKRGVIRQRIAAYGEGETRPVATNETKQGRAKNRRVEIIITPITEES